MDIKEKILEIKSLGTSLKIQTVGEGSPKTLVLSGVHGNEKTGQIVIQKLLEKLTSFPGTLSVLPIANPTGFLNSIRQEGLSGLDLNRNFFSGQESANELIQAIAGIVKGNDFIIDLHNFTTEGLIQVVSNHINSADHLATLFNPDVVRTAGKNQALKRIGTLSSYAKDFNVSYVLIELPIHNKVSEEQIDRIINGILLHLNKSQHIPAYSFDELPKVCIRLIKSEFDGVFIKNSKIALGDNILEGDILGEVRTENGQHIISSPYKGMVCEIDSDEERKVNVGSTLVGIGQNSD